MRGRPGPRAARARRSATVFVFLIFLGVAVAATRPVSVRAEGGGALVAEPVLSASAAGVRELVGASPAEATGEIWGVGTDQAGHQDLVRYTAEGGWEAVPEPIESDGAQVTGLEVPEVATAGRTTAVGGVVMAAVLGVQEFEGPERQRAILVRDPGGQFRAVVPPEGFLEEGEQLFEYKQANQPHSLLLTAVEEADGKTGAFVVPSLGPDQLNTEVLHYDGSSWTREPICINEEPAAVEPAECLTPATPGFKVMALDASGPGNAWLLVRIPRRGALPSQAGQGIALLHREGGEWRRVTLGGALGESYKSEQQTIEGQSVIVQPREQGQPLTVTSKGVWADATIAVGSNQSPRSDATIYLDTEEGDPRAGQVTGAWCSLPSVTPEAIRVKLCSGELPFDLPKGESRSFAWPGDEPGEFGTRAITGVGKGAMLIFENGSFARIPLAGNGGSSAGAALAGPDEGWLGPSYRLTREPVPSGLVSWPVPFRHPLTAIATQPGAPVGEIGAQAVAVGVGGQVARYTPGVGWQPESLLTGSGARATPNLRAVAWPVPGLAFAVGDEGAMWIWRSGTGLWEADPGSPPNLIRGNFTAIAFDPNEPERGYAVGEQGLLLAYGRRWTQEALPAEIGSEPNITSVAFAGNEAIATWSQGIPKTKKEGIFTAEITGGVIVNDGSGWRVEPQATETLTAIEGDETSPRLVAGLSDGGAAIAGTDGAIIEREGPGAPWHAVPGPALGVPAALAAVREGGQLRAIVSVEANAIKPPELALRNVEEPQGTVNPESGQAPLLIEPYPLAASGYVVHQTASGWRDEERHSYPVPPAPTDQVGENRMDIPKVPDPVLALAVSPDGTEGWAVGGQTGDMAGGQFGTYEKEGLQTAAVMRFGEGAAPPANASTSSIPVSSEEATFAIGGNAQCADVCADLSGTGIGPDVWLRSAVGRAASIPGVRAFLYTGTSVAGNLEQNDLTRDEFGEEEAAYSRRLSSTAGSLPVFTTPAQSDVYQSSLAAFEVAFSAFPAPLGDSAAAGVSAGERATGSDSYAFNSTDVSGGGAVRVIALDESTAPLPSPSLCWLGQQLAVAKADALPAIVVGNREVGSEVELEQMLVTGTSPACPESAAGGASAYFYDSPELNTGSLLAWESTTIPAYGTGSLGYIRPRNLKLGEYEAASGFLLASVDESARNPLTNIAPVGARLIPSIGSLAINALDGTLLRRSQTALFEALARRPEAGYLCTGTNLPTSCSASGPDPYVQIPARCAGQPSCAFEIYPEYRFTSSRPDIANFVKVDPASTNPRAVFLNAEGKPEPDPTSGLLCAFNSGTTTVSVETGGLSYSVPITIQEGSVARPCGTVPRTDLAAPGVTPTPLPAEGRPSFEPPPSALPPPPSPAAPPVQIPAPPPTPIPVHHPVPPKPPVPAPQPFFPPSPGIYQQPVIVPPLPPGAAEPAPPTGTSPVTQPAVSPEPEEEEEAAFDLVHHAVTVHHAPRAAAAIAAYRFEPRTGHWPWLIYTLPALVLFAALSSFGIAGRRRRRAPEPAFLKSRR
jgi:hypothetical protein